MDPASLSAPIELVAPETGNLIRQLKDIYVDEVRMKLKSQTPHLVKIKALKDSGAEVSRVTYQEAPF